ncbi:MAG TPA: hypothetical protein VMB02_09840 [Candidatus Aquilonibacter sp.]|nr:hypothetical protein [Candidatus Aquilonibacter sp.]
MNSSDESSSRREQTLVSPAAKRKKPDLADPGLVLSLLEADQVVAAKRQSRFGPRDLSFGIRLLLWGLRVYVVVMLILVVVSVFRAIHGLN